jgi:iron complex outermembrane recepter protein
MSTRISIRRAVHLVLVGSAASAAVLTTPVMAADEASQPISEVIVTGSRISRSDYTAESPITIVNAEKLLEAGQADLGEALRTQMAVTMGGFSKSSNLSGGGAQAIDLRNLGTDRVLTLINGRRMPRFADALQNEAADLSLIPMAMVERVEILRDGASAIYGADAVSGVVNIILKENYEGFQLTAGSGITDFGDADEYQLQGVFGVGNEEGGNLVLSAEYKFRDNVPQRERDWAIPSIAAISATGVVNGSGAHPGGSITFVNPATGRATGNVWCTQPRAFGGDELTNVAGTPRCPANAPSNANDLIGRYDYALVQDIINQEKQFNIAALGKHPFGDAAEGFLEVMYSRRESETVLDANPIFAGQGSPSFPTGWVVPANNPYNPFPGQAAQVTQRPTSTIGPRASIYDATLLRTVVGVRGEDLFGKVNWDISYLNSEVIAHSVTDATFNLRRAITISDPALCAADPLCRAALRPGSTALDVYRPANWSQSEINYIKQIATTDADFEVEGIQLNANAELFDLPAGAFGVAVGFEWREESAMFKPDSVTEAGESIANQTFSTNGSFEVSEFYAEVNVPLLADLPAVKELTLNLQGRYFDYSTFGDDNVYKAGLNYTPTESLRIRSTVGTSFRAPTLVDSFSGGTVAFDFIADPCSGYDAPNSTASATVRANCVAAGVPAGFTQAAAQLPVLAGGDLADGVQDLGPEEADTWTVGLVWSPEFLSGLSASVDYWDITVTNYIDRPDIETEIVIPCYNSSNLSGPTCSQFSRNATGNLTGLVSGAINRVGKVKTSGLDWSLEYGGWEIGPGSLSLDHQGTYVFNYEEPGVTVGAGDVDQGDPFAVPRVRMNFGAEYEVGAFSFGLRTRMIGELDALNTLSGGATANGNNFLGYDKVDAHWEHDVRARWSMGNGITASVGVNNVLGEDPPYVFSTGNNTAVDLYTTAVLGRFYFVRLIADFGAR